MGTEILVTNVSKTYPGGTAALREVDLAVESGSSFALLGPNGAGKSTLTRIMTTLSKPDSGEIRVAGMNPARDTRKIHARIGMASQENDLDPAATAEELLIFQGRLFGMTSAEAKKRAAELIEDFHLQHEAKKKAGTLSGGNKRKLHCALALVHRPRILFLDEPTVGMDPEARAGFWTSIMRLNREQGTTVMLTTQYLEEADKFATTMALLVGGRIEYQGPVSGFKRRVHPDPAASLEDSYLAYIRNYGKPDTQETAVNQGGML